MTIKNLDSIFIENNEIYFKYILSNNEFFTSDEIFFNNFNIDEILDFNDILSIPQNKFFNICFDNNFTISPKFIIPTFNQYNQYLNVINNNETIYSFSLKYSTSILFLIKLFSYSKKDYLNIYEIIKYKFFKNYIENYAYDLNEINEYIENLNLNKNFFINKNIFNNIFLDYKSKTILTENEIFLKEHKNLLELEFNIESKINNNELIIILGFENDKIELTNYIECENSVFFIEFLNQKLENSFDKKIFINLNKINIEFFKFLMEVLKIQKNVLNIDENNLFNNNKNILFDDQFEYNSIDSKNKNKKDKNTRLLLETIPFCFTKNSFNIFKVIKNSIFFNIEIEKLDSNKEILMKNYIFNIIKENSELNLKILDLDKNKNKLDNSNLDNYIFYFNDYEDFFELFQI